MTDELLKHAKTFKELREGYADAVVELDEPFVPLVVAQTVLHEKDLDALRELTDKDVELTALEINTKRKNVGLVNQLKAAVKWREEHTELAAIDYAHFLENEIERVVLELEKRGEDK